MYMIVKEIMHKVDVLPSHKTVAEAAKLMDRKEIGSLLVEQYGKPVGIMTERDVLRKIVAKGRNVHEVKVSEVMSSPVITIDAGSDILEASRLMDEKRIRRIIVVENGIIVGKLTANSISRNLKFMLVNENDYVRPQF